MSDQFEADVIKHLRRENARFRAALELYSAQRNWRRSRPGGPVDEWINCDDDKWNGYDVAIAALEKTNG